MASELYVETLKGLTSGVNANKVIIPAGQTLDVSDWSPPAGTVLQVVSNTNGTDVSLSQNAAFNTVVDVSITPSSAASKILILAVLKARGTPDGGGKLESGHQITRFVDSETIIYGEDTYAQSFLLGSFTYGSHIGAINPIIDSPNTTSSVTYRIKASVPNGTLVFNGFNAKSTVTVMEIAG